MLKEAAIKAIVKETVKNAPSIKQGIRRIGKRITKGKAVIYIFGGGGVGKTTIHKLLEGQPLENLASTYDPSILTETGELSGDDVCAIKTVPGQTIYIDREWTKLVESAKRQKEIFLIHVVAYGFHSLCSTNMEETDYFRENEDVTAFRDRYLLNRRGLEHKNFSRLLSMFHSISCKIHIITIINKMDMWLSNKNAVIKHYQSQAYNNSIKQLENKIGIKNVENHLITTALDIGPLLDSEKRIIANSEPGFGLDSVRQSKKDMINKLNNIVSQRTRWKKSD